MGTYRSFVFLVIFLLLVAAEGRSMQAIVHDNVSSSNISLLGSTDSGTTDPNDVKGTLALVDGFPQLIEFGMAYPTETTDPCYPQILAWVECSNDTVRRVTALNLANNMLYGSLPDFSSMDALQTIDLHQNFLLGDIPEFLGTFPKLTYLNLASNYFSGVVPDSLLNNKKLKLDVSDNAYLCTSSCSPPARGGTTPTPSDGVGGFDFGDTNGKQKKRKSKLPAILGATCWLFDEEILV